LTPERARAEPLVPGLRRIVTDATV